MNLYYGNTYNVYKDLHNKIPSLPPPPPLLLPHQADDECLAKLKEAYSEGDKTIGQYIVGVAYNLSTFM